MLGIHVRKQALNTGAVVPLSAIHDPPVTSAWVTTPPPDHHVTGGKRSCPGTGPDNTTYPAGELVPLEANGGTKCYDIINSECIAFL